MSDEVFRSRLSRMARHQWRAKRGNFLRDLDSGASREPRGVQVGVDAPGGGLGSASSVDSTGGPNPLGGRIRDAFLSPPRWSIRGGGRERAGPQPRQFS